MPKKRTLYHCSIFDQGDVLTVKRQTPLFPDDKEPPVPRLCVSPTVPQCLSARLFPAHRDVHVYATKNPTKGVTPFNVWDEKITDERWLLPGVQLMKVDVIRAAVSHDIYDDVRLWHHRTRKAASFRHRVALLWRCVVSLPQYAKGLSWIESCLSDFDIDPIEIWQGV